MDFTFHPLKLSDAYLIECQSFKDKRGSFSELYRQSLFAEYNIGPFVQENYSSSVKNTIRGLHYQAFPMQVGKLISCPHGKIFDVMVDIRKGSPTLGQWEAVLLEEGNAMVWVPPGFAHGFYVLSGIANVVYRQTQYYSKAYDRCIRWNDSDIGIVWPIENGTIISDKDMNAPLFKDAELLL